jgi:predicted phage terminase large subunit-like protein
MWKTSNGAEYMAAGILSGITGNRASGMIIDDPIRGRRDADSPTVRKAVIEAYQDDLLTRMKPGGWMVLVQTRWHVGDLAGSLLPDNYDGRSGPVMCTDGLVWEVVNVPAEAVREDDPLGRPKGGMLWPEYFDERHWIPLRRNNRTWNALCQQNPVPDSGGQFEREWFENARYEVADRPKFLNRFSASDYAVTELEDDNDPDYTVHGIAGVDSEGTLWMLDWWRKQCDSGTGINALINLCRKNGVRRGFGEVGIIRRAIEPAFKRAQRDEKYPINVEYLPAIGDKIAKVQSFRALAMSGQVRFPRTPWADLVIDLLCAFPAVSHDDDIDVCGLFGRALDEMAFASLPAEDEPDTSLKPYSVAWLMHGTDDSKPKGPRVM